MRRPHLTSTVLAAVAAVAFGAFASSPALSQQPKGAPQQAQPGSQDQQTLAPPKAYKPVPIKLPQPVRDPTFVAFRKQLEGIAQKKDRNALARIVSQQFFWVPEDKDVAQKGKSGIDNLSAAIGLDGADAQGWELLLDLADEPTAEPYPGRQGAICAPGEASFDDKAAEELANATQTDPGEWGYPAEDGVPVRAGAAENSQVTGKLGLELVRAYPDDSPAAAVQGNALRIVLPSGKLGFINGDLLRPLLSDQLCYVKEGNVWKITGAIGGGGPDDGSPQ
jgi:hypothetical protein